MRCREDQVAKLCLIDVWNLNTIRELRCEGDHEWQVLLLSQLFCEAERWRVLVDSVNNVPNWSKDSPKADKIQKKPETKLRLIRNTKGINDPRGLEHLEVLGLLATTLRWNSGSRFGSEWIVSTRLRSLRRGYALLHLGCWTLGCSSC